MEIENSNKFSIKIKWGRQKLDFELDTTDCYDTFKGKIILVALLSRNQEISLLSHSLKK